MRIQAVQESRNLDWFSNASGNTQSVIARDSSFGLSEWD